MEKKFITVDGNGAAAQVAYQFTEVAAIYPITPSSPMATLTDQWSAQGKKNMFGQQVSLVEMQSEAGAIGAIHGSLQAGALSTSFTSSQGLMLMVPVLYRIAGEHLPAVLHVAARTVGTHGMSIFGDHSDVMACRDTGFALFSSGSVQEVADLSALPHLAALKGRVPFIHFFDGFRTSHELSRIAQTDPAAFTQFVDQDALRKFREHALNPEHPILRNTVQNGDVYFQTREASNPFYDALPGIVEDYLQKINSLCGTDYHLFNYYGAPDATDVIVAMGSVSGTIQETVDYLNARGKKTGFLQVHLYRPFAADAFLKALPTTTKRICVLDRCKNMGRGGEPLFQDVCTVLMSEGSDIKVVGGRYGLSSKDTDPAQIAAAFENLAAESPVRGFTIGIEDDVTHLSLPVRPLPDFTAGDGYSCKFWGLGGDGTVGANHNTVQIVGDCAGLYSQAYFEYDAKKSFGTTKSHLKFSKAPIRGSYFVKNADFVACHNENFMQQYDIVQEIKPGGILLLNCQWKEAELSAKLPGKVRRIIAQNKIQLFIIDATEIAQKLNLGTHTNTVLQAAFFHLTGLISEDLALEQMKAAVRKSYFTKGDEVIARNIAAIDAGVQQVQQVAVPESWLTAPDDPAADESMLPPVVRNILFPINRQKGDDLPVSAFKGREDGSIEMGLTAYEKRGIAIQIPQWDPAKCIQCNRCALVCSHAVIRPYLLNEEEAAKAPEGFKMTKAMKADGLQFAMQVSAYDCTGCGVCVNACPCKEKAITMVPALLNENQKLQWEYGLSLSDKGDVYDPKTIKGSQFRQPLVEFSAACAGCGETPYAKLMTQLFGDRVYWANGTGCSQAWGAPMPGIPYTTNKRGFGPAWTNSLFENNAELMLGILLSARQQREGVKMHIEEYLQSLKDDAAKGDRAITTALEEWLAVYDDCDGSRKASDKLIALLEKEDSPKAKEILQAKDHMAKKSFWMYGGDGWAYDIGFGGLDHVIASGENIKVLVIDTEVYSNTGGQSSKATPVGAVAQFTSSGKRTRKKDLGAIMMSYGNVYVAQVAMGADPNQLIKVLCEAEAYDGPSVIIAYCPCTAHGIRAGVSDMQNEAARAVKSGYWPLYHYDPRKEVPMELDCAAPTLDYEDFLAGENRYAALYKTYPENAKLLFAKAKEEAKQRYEKYKDMTSK